MSLLFYFYSIQNSSSKKHVLACLKDYIIFCSVISWSCDEQYRLQKHINQAAKRAYKIPADIYSLKNHVIHLM